MEHIKDDNNNQACAFTLSHTHTLGLELFNLEGILLFLATQASGLKYCPPVWSSTLVQTEIYQLEL